MQETADKPLVTAQRRSFAAFTATVLFIALFPAPSAGAAETYDMYFPVVGAHYYSDDFGAPRGDHTHQGNDIMTYGVKGVPVIAVASGTVGWTSTNCCAMELEHDDGWSSWYIHLNNDTPGTDDGMGWGFAPGIEPGVHVEAGQLIGFVGDSGNAEGTAPHLHFELHDATGTAINPYEHLNNAKPPPVCDGEPANIIGTSGDDVLVGTDGADVIIGLEGDDEIHALSGADKVCSGEGEDIVFAGQGTDLVMGGKGNDLLLGGKGNDTLFGQRGHDTIKGGTGDDSVFGGKGDDTMSFLSSESGVFVDLSLGTAEGEGSDTVVGVENLIGSNQADTLIGNELINRIEGQKGSDVIDGGEEADVLKGGRGHDQLSGSDGDDTIKAGRGNDDVVGGEGGDEVLGHEGDDVLDGSSGDDSLNGGSGSDTCLNGESLEACEA